MRNATDFALSLMALTLVGVVLFWIIGAAVVVGVIVLALAIVPLKMGYKKILEMQQDTISNSFADAKQYPLSGKQIVTYLIDQIQKFNDQNPDYNLNYSGEFHYNDLQEKSLPSGDESLSARDLGFADGPDHAVSLDLDDNGVDRLTLQLSLSPKGSDLREALPFSQQSAPQFDILTLSTGVAFLLPQKGISQVNPRFGDLYKIKKAAFGVYSDPRELWQQINKRVEAQIVSNAKYHKVRDEKQQIEAAKSDRIKAYKS